MWKLLKSEIEYQKLGLLLGILFVLFAAIGVLRWGWTSVNRDVPGLSTIMVTTNIVILFFRILRMIKEKSDRVYIQLPQSLQNIAWMRLLFILTFWLASSGIFWIALTIIRPQAIHVSIVWYLLSVTGLMMAANAFPFIHRDLRFYLTGKYQLLILTAIYVVVLMSVTLFFSVSAISRYFPFNPLEPVAQLKMYFDHFAWKPLGSLFFLLTGAGLTLSNLYIFNQRRSYLE